MANQDKKDVLENKEGKIKRNDWGKVVNIILIVITLYLLNIYDVFEYTGVIMGILLVFVWGILINYLVDKIFYLFIH